MSLYERLASSLIGTPLQGPAEKLRWLSKLPKRLKHPELKELHLEGERTDEVFRRAITDGTNCIDVGSHLGSVLQTMINLSPRGQHLAVEPIPYKAAWLRKKYPNVEIQQTALGDRESRVEFFINPRHSGFSGMRKHHSNGDVTRIEVDCRTLDSLVPQGRTIGFVKIDVEGAELGVFRGARKILAESRPVILFECTKSGLDSFECAAADVFRFLVDEAGYQVYLIKDWLAHNPPLELGQFEASMVYPFQAFNYIAAPRRD